MYVLPFLFFSSNRNLPCRSIDAQSEAALRLLKTNRVWPKNKLKLEKEWTLSFHEMIKRDLASKPFFFLTPLISRDAD